MSGLFSGRNHRLRPAEWTSPLTAWMGHPADRLPIMCALEIYPDAGLGDRKIQDTKKAPCLWAGGVPVAAYWRGCHRRKPSAGSEGQGPESKSQARPHPTIASAHTRPSYDRRNGRSGNREDSSTQQRTGIWIREALREWSAILNIRSPHPRTQMASSVFRC